MDEELLGKQSAIIGVWLLCRIGGSVPLPSLNEKRSNFSLIDDS